jgi:hypothetical protein
MPKTTTKTKSTATKSASKSRKPAVDAAANLSSGEPDAEALEQTGWLLLDAAEYQRELAGGREVPADKWLRGSAKRDLLRRSRQLADDGDPFGVADQITEMVKQTGSN